MAQVQITSANLSDRRSAAAPKTVKDSQAETRTPAPNGPALSGEGLEMVRSSHC